MKTVAIIAEFNPMHTGHKYLVQKAKEITGADICICLMSGNFTQSGNIALKNKFDRANIAINNGFDIVIELPTVYATSSAEFFAYGAVNLLNSLNIVDYLCFGSETGDIDEITNISKKLINNNDKIWSSITESMNEGVSFASAREYAIGKFLTKEEVEISSKSNNILAIEYVKSLLKLNSTITPIAIKREENTFISATKIREMISSNMNTYDMQKYILNPHIILDKPVLNNTLFSFLKYEIILKGKNDIKRINEVTEGLENKIYNELNNSNTYDEFIQNIKSKRYQLSKIKRIMINILLNITKTTFSTLNTTNALYAHVLAIKPEMKNSILSYLNKQKNIPIITSINDNIIQELDDSNREALYLDILASNIYSIISNDKVNKDYTNML